METGKGTVPACITQTFGKSIHCSWFSCHPFLLQLAGSPVSFNNYQVPGLAGEQLPHLGGRAEQTQHAERSPLQACSLWENDHELRTVMRKL